MEQGELTKKEEASQDIKITQKELDCIKDLSLEEAEKVAIEIAGGDEEKLVQLGEKYAEYQNSKERDENDKNRVETERDIWNTWLEESRKKEEAIKKDKFFINHDGVKEFYNEDGKLLKREYPDGTKKYYDYDDESNLDFKINPDGTKEFYNKKEKTETERPIDEGEEKAINWDFGDPQPKKELGTKEEKSLDTNTLIEEKKKEDIKNYVKSYSGNPLDPGEPTLKDIIKTKKEEKKNIQIEELKKTIENAQKILEENKIRKEAILKRMAELKKKEESKTEEKKIETIKEESETTPEKEVKMEENKEEIEVFDTKYIENKVRELLSSKDAIKKINNLKIEGDKNSLKLQLDFEGESKKKFLPTIKVNGIITTTLSNKNNTIFIEEPDIQATKTDKALINIFLTPELDRVSETLKSFIEKEKNKKVEKIWIEDGELKVLYKKETGALKWK